MASDDGSELVNEDDLRGRGVGQYDHGIRMFDSILQGLTPVAKRDGVLRNPDEFTNKSSRFTHSFPLPWPSLKTLLTANSGRL